MAENRSLILPKESLEVTLLPALALCQVSMAAFSASLVRMTSISIRFMVATPSPQVGCVSKKENSARELLSIGLDKCHRRTHIYF
jgi:hypothetical protein